LGNLGKHLVHRNPSTSENITMQSHMSISMGTFKKGLVSIIIPTITRSKFTSLKTLVKKLYLLEDGVRDIKKNVKVLSETIVICNSSQDRKLIDFVTKAPEIDKYCINSVNVGVPRGWNMGAEMAQGEYLCFTNDDVEIGEGALERMVEVLDQEEVGEVGPNGGKWFRQKSGKRVGTHEIEDAEEISGWLFMVKREVFDKVGGFDLAYTPALCEEIDLSFAIRDAGYRCIVIPGINAVHHHISGASSTKKPIRALDIEIKREELTTRNLDYFEKKWAHFWE
jgi:GT2 family glycosyltransferase